MTSLPTQSRKPILCPSSADIRVFIIDDEVHIISQLLLAVFDSVSESQAREARPNADETKFPWGKRELIRINWDPVLGPSLGASCCAVLVSHDNEMMPPKMLE